MENSTNDINNEETMNIVNNEARFSDELYAKIITEYLDTKSVKKTAENLKTNPVKVRKVLITENLWSSRTSLEIQHYLNMGMNTAQIAEKMFTSEKAVQQYLPYTRGIYNGDNPTVAAMNSADYRERIRVAKEKTLRRNLDIAIQNQWKEMYEPLTVTAVDAMKDDGIDKIDDMYELYDSYFPGMLRVTEGEDTSKFKMPFFVDPIRLHLELMIHDSEYEDITNEHGAILHVRNKYYDEKVDSLKKYGEVKYGNTITRDIIVPGDMQLWALNYTIQKCFGWQNSHLHCFEFTEEMFDKICDENAGNYLNLVGVAIRSPWMSEEDEFWADDYEGGSIKTWLRSKYTGPYESMCHGEGIWQSKKDVAEIRKQFRYVKLSYTVGDDGHKFYDWPTPLTKEEYDNLRANGPIQTVESEGFYKGKIRTLEACTVDKLPLDAIKWISEGGANKILERLSVEDVFVIHDKGLEDEFFADEKVPECYDDVMTEDVIEDIKRYKDMDYVDAQPMVFGLSDELIYSYDFGDGWQVKVTASFGAADLIEAGRIAQEELDEAVLQLYKTYRPVCIAQDGLPVLDDVGGLRGFAEFLKGINNEADRDSLYANKKESLAWARSLGWSMRKVSNKNLL